MKQDKAHIRISNGNLAVTENIWLVTITEGTKHTVYYDNGRRFFRVEIKSIERDKAHDYEKEMGFGETE